MTVGDLAELSCLQLATEGTALDAPVEGGHVGDLLSVVMGNAQANQLWVTIQSHVNIIAVAALAGIPAIIIAQKVAYIASLHRGVQSRPLRGQL